jgi:hypothetical protein
LIGIEPSAWGCKRAIPGLSSADHGPAVEIYTAARFFTVTGRLWSTAHRNIEPIDGPRLEQLARLIPPPTGGCAGPASGHAGSGAGDHTPRLSAGGDNSRSARAVRAAVAMAPDSYEEMVDGLRNHPDADIRAWVQDKGEAHNERELKRIWRRFIAKRAAAREPGLADLEDRTGASNNFEPNPIGDGHDPDTEARSTDPLVALPGAGGEDRGQTPPEPPNEGDADEGGDEDQGGDEDEGNEDEDRATTAEELKRRLEKVRRNEAHTLAKFNATYAVVNEAGRVIVVKWQRDPMLNREVLDRFSFEDFRKLYLNRTIGTVTKDKDGNEQIGRRNLGDWWLKHPRRRQFISGVTFDPTGGAPASYMNLWRDFGVPKNKPGDWSLMRRHIEIVICGGNAEYSDYLLNWLARMVRFPSLAGEVAIVLRSDEEGTGKGILGRWLVAMMGRHGLQIAHAGQLVGRFNEHLRDLVFLFPDEAFFAGDEQHEGVLKSLITEYATTIEGKYRAVISVKNMLHILMASNRDWVIPARLTARRFCMFDVLDVRRDNREYFTALDRQMRNGGAAAMLYDLLRRDISGFEVRDVPQTAALATQRLLSLSSLESWWATVLSRGFLYESRHGAPHLAEWHEFAATELLWNSYQQWAGKTRPTKRQPREALKRFMTQMYEHERPRAGGPYAIREHEQLHGLQVDKMTDEVTNLDEVAIHWQDRPRGYRFGTLEEAQDRFLVVHPGALTLDHD